MIDSLRSCPFCGSNEVLPIVRSDEYSDNYRVIYCFCRRCKAQTAAKGWHSDDIGAGTEHAIRNWNTRSQSHAPEASPVDADSVLADFYRTSDLKGVTIGEDTVLRVFYRYLLRRGFRQEGGKGDVSVEDNVPVFYCKNGDSLQGLEKGALAVLSNMMMRANAAKASFEIGNEADGNFVFECTWHRSKITLARCVPDDGGGS